MPFHVPQTAARLRRLWEGYRPEPGIADEMVDAEGRIRPVWRQFTQYLASLKPDDLRRRMDLGDQYLADAGVYYRQYDGATSAERDWPLSHIPVLIEESDWKKIVPGLIQRANLLEAIMADLYGQNRLAEQGFLPASLIAASQEWLRPLVGAKPRGGHFLHFLAFEIGRGPNGDWWVLGDRTQAPSGAGFALENRVATTRAFADYFATANVHRLAGFFRRFRDTLNGMRSSAINRVSILTPGPLNETYFEHAYIARYLGFGLLEGEDLTVENGRLMVRTVAGPLPVDVLWRRLDSNFADPLELDSSSQLGTPGLVRAMRDGHVTLVNALGSGVLEIRALLAFMPRLCQHLIGEPLALPNIATWWCGEPSVAQHVRDNLANLVLGEALSTGLPFEAEEGPQPDLPLDKLLETAPQRLVGQEVVKLSTTPAMVDGALRPRPMSLRVFLARTADGWDVMPGGYARIGKGGDSTAIAMRRGGAVADAWVVSSDPVKPDTMLTPDAGPFTRAPPGTLPSRAADNLYWLGRYVERTEGHLRLLRAYHLRLAEAQGGQGPGAKASPILALVETALSVRGLDPTEPIPPGMLSTIDAAIGSASKIRDRFSIDGWMALNDLAKTARRFAEKLEPGDDSARAISVLLRKVSGFTGLVHENMYRFVGWRFMSIGRALERAMFMSDNLAEVLKERAPEGALDFAIEIGDSAMTHRRRYSVATTRETVVDLLGLDAMNPRSVLYSANDIHEHVGFLPGASVHGQMSELARAVLRMQSGLAVLSPEALDAPTFRRLYREAASLSDLITATYFR